jgi:hypothetical protein
VRDKFREEAASIGKTDYTLIEHKIRYGYKQKKLIEMPGFNAASVITKIH